MRHFSLFDGMDDGFKKKADDDYDFNRKNMYYTIDAGPDGIGGFLDLITWVHRNEDILRMMPATRSSIPSPEEIDDLSEYLNDLWSADDNVLRVNGEQLSNLRMLSKMFTAIEEEPDQEAFADEYRDLVFDDIQAARESLSGAIPNYSSMEGLEDILTMEKNPEDLAEGETPAVVHETCPSCGGSNTFSTIDEFGEVRCDECGALDPRDEEWENPTFEGPSPVPPATNAGKELAAGNCPQCGVDAVNATYGECENCGWDQDNACPECFNDRSITVDEFGSKRCNNCGWAEEPEYPALAPDAPGVLPPLSDAGNKIKSLEDAYNAPSVEHPLGPHTGAEEGGQELYTSGRFVKNGDRWFVTVAPSAGQREPMSGDLATIQQKSKAFNRPVPVTLVDDMGGAWTFKNGHHPA